MPSISAPTTNLYTVEDARNLARRRVPRIMFDFVDGAAGNERAAAANNSAFDRIFLQPRVLVNVAERKLATSLFGRKMAVPFGFAPMGMCNLTWPSADTAMAHAAHEYGTVVCVSTAASTTLEEMHRNSQGRAWFQLYAGQSEEVTFSFVERAQNAGYDVLVLTVDVPQVSRRVRDLKNGFRVPFRIGPKQLLDFSLHPRWSIGQLLHGIPKLMNFETAENGAHFVRGENRSALDYDFLDRLRQGWNGQIVVKGVTSPDDAKRVKAAGVDAIYVSNHGGRQLDSVPPAIDLLPHIRAAIGDDFPLIFDSGIRSGEDVIKALALGADFVMLGRPLLYAIGADGARGLRTLLDILRDEVSVTLAQIGVQNIRNVTGEAIFRPDGVASNA